MDMQKKVECRRTLVSTRHSWEELFIIDLKEAGLRVWARVIWFRTGSKDGLSCTIGFHKSR
jgi:hypothetical protein